MFHEEVCSGSSKSNKKNASSACLRYFYPDALDGFNQGTDWVKDVIQQRLWAKSCVWHPNMRESLWLLFI